MASLFSEDGKYFAKISSDGKLKLWNTISNEFEQEFTSDFHLVSPCTSVHFMQGEPQKYKGGSPKKKKRKNSECNSDPDIVIGTCSGLLLIYSISKASLEYTINSETNLPISCLSIDYNNVYSGAEQNVLVWDLKERKLTRKWKAGIEKLYSILAIPQKQQIVTAAKNIKLWDVSREETLRTFTGHSSEVCFLQYIPTKSIGDGYFISGSKGDRLLNLWTLSDKSRDKNAIASFLMEDIVQNISVHIGSDGSTNLATTVRSGVVHVYNHTLNGKCGKPLKPKTTLQVVTDSGQTDEVVTPIRIFGAIYRDEETLCIGHGTDVILTFENVVVSNYKKLQCLIRKDPRAPAGSKQHKATKTITPVVNDDVHYLSSQNSNVSTTKRKNDGKIEVPMEQRLENLTLNNTESSSKLPKSDNVAQLLVQGLHSKDKNILRTVLCKREEEVIRNTVKRLPVSAFVPLVQELTGLIQGKTLSSQIGSLWLKHVLQVHAGVLIANPELPEILGPTLGTIENRLALLTPLNRLRGRLDLVLPQISRGGAKESAGEEEPLLHYKDGDSSESDEDLQIELHSESGSEWNEESENEVD